MQESPNTAVSRIRLEGLSTDELIKLADTYGVDIPHDLERIFIIEEILEIVNAEKEEPENPIEVNPSYSESALLPKQYNISYVEVIIRDPLWIYVFWEIKSHDREMHENAGDFRGYFLRIIPVDNEGKELHSKEDYFTVLVSKDDSARYLGFAGEKSLINNGEDLKTGGSVKTNCYRIKLGVMRGKNEITIASSPPFILPALCENENIASMSHDPLLRLSGVQNLSIIKNINRNVRTKR